jgi:hypothetical protein
MAAADDDTVSVYEVERPEDEPPPSREVFAKSYLNNLFGMYTVERVVDKDGRLLYYEFTFVRNPIGVHQYLGVEPGHKTIVRPNTRMGWGDFDDVTPDKIVTTVLRW